MAPKGRVSSAKGDTWGWLVVLGATVTHVIVGGLGSISGIICQELETTYDINPFLISWTGAIMLGFLNFGGKINSLLKWLGFSLLISKGIL